MFSIYLRLLYSFVYFKVLRKSKEDMFKHILTQFKNHQEPKCFEMVYNPHGEFVTRYPLFSILVQALSSRFLVERKLLEFNQGDDVTLDTPMLQYGKYGLLIFSISEFQEYLKSQNYYLVYVCLNSVRCLTVVSQLTAGCVEYTPNKYIVGNVTPYLLGEEGYIYSLVLRDMGSYDGSIKPTLFQKIESHCLKSKLDKSGQPGIGYFTKKYQKKSQISTLSDISNPEKVFGDYFGREYSYIGFSKFIASLGYSLTDDLTVVKC